MKINAIVFFVCLCLPISLSAHENLMTDVFVLDTITVTGNKNKTEDLDRSSAVVVERNRSNNIADFLLKDTEISLSRKANLGDSSDIISIRGMGSKRIQLNMDGRDISSTGVVGGNFLDFGTIPLDNIERIEVIKGGSSIEYGNTALGGVVNAYSRKPTETPYLSIYATMGGWNDAYDFHNIRGSYAQKFGPLGASIGLSHQKNEAFLWNNDFELFHLNPKIYLDTAWDGEFAFSYNYSRAKRGLIMSNRADGNPINDDNPYLSGWNKPLNPNYPLASGESFAGSSPSPAMYVIGEGAHWVKQRHLLDLSYKQKVGETGFYEIMAYSSYETRHEKNYANNEQRQLLWENNTNNGANPRRDLFDINKTRDGDLVMDKKINVDRSFGYKFKAGFNHENHKIKFGADYMIRRIGDQQINYIDENYNWRAQGGRGTGVMNGSDRSDPTYITGVYIGDQYLINDMLTLDYGLRYDGYDARSKQKNGSKKSYKDGGVSPKAMLTWNIDDKQSASLALYRNIRVPAANEYGWFRMAADPMAGGVLLSKVEGQNLKLEKANGIDLAYKYNFNNDGFAKISAWYYDVKDYINMRSNLPQSERSPNSPGKGGNLRTAYNMDVRLYGISISGECPLSESFSLHSGLTWQDSKKKNDMFDPSGLLSSLEYVPQWKANLGFNWEISEDLNLDADILYVDKRHYFFNAANKYESGTLGSFATVGASLSYKLNQHSTMEIYADNISNTKYEERWGYPAMGFNAGVSFKWEL